MAVPGKKSVLIRLDKKFYDDIHKVMCYALEVDGITTERMHTGNNQQWFRDLLQIGLGIKLREWEQIKKKYESQDNN